MRVIKFYILFQLLFLKNFYSQKYQDFSLPVPEQKISFSNYNLIKIIDQRTDTFNIGFALTESKKKAKLVRSEVPLAHQLQNFLDNYSVEQKDGELLLQLRKIKFVYYSSSEEEIGYFFFRANIYSKKNDNYENIITIDTILKVSKLDPVKNIKQSASELFRDFFLRSLTISAPGKNKKTYFEILKTDSIEKSNLKVYKESKFVNGVYMNFNSFKNQIPDYPNAKIIFSHGKIKKVKFININKSITTADPASIFAIVEKGNIYISTLSGFVPLIKKNNDFFFIDNGYISHDESDMSFTTTQLSVIDKTTILASDRKIYFEVKLDHIDGSFMRCKNIETH